MNEDARLWTVGELATAAGVTVRALHHYDELGLLRPSERWEAGYRLYDEDALPPALPDPRAAGIGVEEVGDLRPGRRLQRSLSPREAEAARSSAPTASSPRPRRSGRAWRTFSWNRRSRESRVGATDRHNGGDEHEREVDPHLHQAGRRR